MFSKSKTDTRIKNLTYESKIIDLQAGEQHDAEYIKLNPNHVVPTLICDEKILVESSLILEFLKISFLKNLQDLTFLKKYIK